MLSREEQGYLFALTRSMWPCTGHVVEMGPWLGGSTACLAAGMAENPARGKWKLHTFDSFVWDDFMVRPGTPALHPGDSFESSFRENISPWRSIVDIHVARLPDELTSYDREADTIRRRVSKQLPLLSWRVGDPVDILFVDGAKSWTGMRFLLGQVAESLRPDARIVFQDYKYWASYWVPATAELLSDHIEISNILRNNTVTFVVKKPIPASRIEAIPEWNTLDADQVLMWIDAASERLRQAGDILGAMIVYLGGVRLLRHKGQDAAAVERFQRVEALWPLSGEDGNLTRARTFLESESSARIRPTARTHVRGGFLRCARLLRRIWAATFEEA